MSKSEKVVPTNLLSNKIFWALTVYGWRAENHIHLSMCLFVQCEHELVCVRVCIYLPLAWTIFFFLGSVSFCRWFGWKLSGLHTASDPFEAAMAIVYMHDITWTTQKFRGGQECIGVRENHIQWFQNDICEENRHRDSRRATRMAENGSVYLHTNRDCARQRRRVGIE